MKTFKELMAEFYDYPPTTPDEKKFYDIHTIKTFDYPVKNSDGLPFKDDKIRQPGTQHKKPASYDPPKEPTNVYKKVNDLNKRIKYKVDEEVEQVDEVSKKTLGRYINAAVVNKDQSARNAQVFADLGNDARKEGDIEGAKTMYGKAFTHATKASNRQIGIRKAVDRLTKEDIELDEQSLLPKTIHVTPGGYGTHYVLDMAHDVDVEHPSNPGNKLNPGDSVSEKDMAELSKKGHEVKVVNEERSDSDAVSDYLKKGGKVKKLKPRVARGISYMRGRSREKGVSTAAWAQHKNSKTFSEVMSYIHEKKLTSAEMKKREEVAKAIERENPSMPKPMKMAIATKTAKRVAEELNLNELLGVDYSQIDEEGIFEYNDVLSLLAIASDNNSEIELFFEDSEESLLLDKDVCDLILSAYSELDEESQAKFEHALQESHKGFMYCVDFANTLQEELANENN